MGIIVLSVIVGGMIGSAVALLMYSAKTRREYREFLVAAKAIVRVSNVEDIDTVVQRFEEIELKYGFHFISALKSLDSTWTDVGMPRRHFENILAALVLSQEALRAANDSGAREGIGEARRQLVSQIVIARQLVSQQAVLGSAVRIDNITEGMLSGMHRIKEHFADKGAVRACVSK